MRYHKNVLVRVSEDVITNPKLIRFKDEFIETDDLLITALDPISHVFTAGVHTLDLSQFTTINWFYFKADTTAITIKFESNVNAITFLPDKANEMWGNFTAIEITTSVDTRITYALGGV